MTIRQLIPVLLLFGACSAEPTAALPAGSVHAVGAVVAGTPSGSSSDPSLPFSGGQVVAPTQGRLGPSRVAVTAPPDVPTPPPAAPSFGTAAQAAAASLDALANVVALDPRGKRGFASAAEVTASALDAGLPVQFLGLNSLLAFVPGQSTQTLAVDKQEVMYPILVGGNVRSSVTVQKGSDGQWRAVKFGYGAVASSSHAVRASVNAHRAVDAGTLSLIEAPAVHALLLSHLEKGVHMVTPLRDIPGTSYKAGVTQPAAQLLAALQPVAARVRPGVPD